MRSALALSKKVHNLALPASSSLCRADSCPSIVIIDHHIAQIILTLIDLFGSKTVKQTPLNIEALIEPLTLRFTCCIAVLEPDGTKEKATGGSTSYSLS